jgi:hypothetical protein
VEEAAVIELILDAPDVRYLDVLLDSDGRIRLLPAHALIPHSDTGEFDNVPRTFDGLRKWLADRDIEGIVFHHEDGRMAKIKLRDFGLKRAK